jgi:hypothetical protein
MSPLQLCFLEIFNLVGTFWSYTISKQAKWNEKRSEHALDFQSRAGHVPCTPCSGVRTPRRIRGGLACVWGLRRPVDRAPRPAKPQSGPTCAVRHAVRGAVNTILPPRPRVALQSRQLVQLALEVLLAAKSQAPLPLSQAGPSRRRAVHSAVPCCAAVEPAAPHPTSAGRPSSLPPLVPYSSLDASAPPPGRQDAPVPDQERSSGRSRASTPPAPFDHISPPSKPQNEIMVSPSSLPTTSPVNPGDELAGFWSSPPAMAPEDYIASISVFPGSFP